MATSSWNHALGGLDEQLPLQEHLKDDDEKSYRIDERPMVSHDESITRRAKPYKFHQHRSAPCRRKTVIGVRNPTGNTCSAITSRADISLSRTECDLILRGMFIEDTFPKGSARFVGFDYMLNNVQHNKTLALAMRTLQCVLVGRARNNAHLSRQAAIGYCQAMSSLRSDLCTETIEPGHFVAIVHLFFNIELFKDTATQASGWQQHIVGARLAFAGCQQPDIDPALRTLMKAVCYEFGLWDGLLNKRQALSVLSESPCTNAPVVWSDFLCTTLRVPIVLESAEKLCRLRSKAAPRSIMSAIETITAMERGLHEATRACYNEISGLPYWLSQDETFAADLGYKQGEVFPKYIYAFVSFQIANQHTTYWMCLLSLRQAHLDLLDSVARSQLAMQTPQHRARLKQSAGECADQLVMSLCYILKRNNGHFGLTKAIAPLQLAFLWYRRWKDAALMLHCQRIAERIQDFGLNCPWSEW